jgi:D-3-phosphoglycerate dehydrogenase
MRAGSLFLNLSRGIVVDHTALREHLISGHLAGAAVDVFPTEPKGRGDEFVSELRGLPNVILTPHIGGSTEEAQADIGGFVANKLSQFVRDGNTTLSKNLPSVALPQQPGTKRIVHVHLNTPGVLAQVNSILAEHAVNIEGQLLSTRGEYGYLITDISGEYGDGVLQRLRAMAQTVRLRVL